MSGEPLDAVTTMAWSPDRPVNLLPTCMTPVGLNELKSANASAVVPTLMKD